MLEARKTWRETAAVTGAAAVVLAAINWLAFKTFFFAEAFVYIGSYRSAGNSFLGAVFSPHGRIFFRPVLWALNLPWNLILPADPFLYHLRNYGFVVLSVAVFHRLLLRLVDGRWARVLAVGYLAVSKIHFTTIGYVATLSTIYVSLLTMGAMLCFLRWLATKKTIDYAATLVFAGLCIGSKDYGAAVLAVLAAIAVWRRRDLGPPGREALRWGVPLAALLLLYAVLRVAIVGVIARTAAYSMSIDPHAAADKALLALALLGNLSVIADPAGIAGSKGISQMVFPHQPRAALTVEWALLIVFVAVLAAAVYRSRRQGALLLVPVVWAGAFYLPTFVTNNLQLYYCNDLVVAAALLVGISLDRLSAAEHMAWAGMVGVLGVNAAASATQSAYAFQYVGQLTAPIAAAASRVAGRSIDRIVCIGRDPVLWNFALTSDSLGPMIPELFKDERLGVFVVRPDEAARPQLAGANTLVLDADRQFAEVDPPAVR